MPSQATGSSTWQWLEIQPLDRSIVRDGRPFGGENNRLHTLPWPLPGTAAGAVRAFLGVDSVDEGDSRPPFIDSRAEGLKRIRVQGPFLTSREGHGRQLFFPAPRDLWAAKSLEGAVRVAALRPQPADAGEGTDLEWPLSLAIPPFPDKPLRQPALWSTSLYTRWLTADVRGTLTMDEGTSIETAIASYVLREKNSAAAMAAHSGWFRAFPDVEWRVHVQMDVQSGRAADGGLFATSGLRLGPNDSFICAVDETDWEERWGEPGLRKGVHLFGGEGGLAGFRTVPPPDDAFPQVWPGVSSGLRMVLVTPAIFRQGWLPGWLDPSTLSGEIPGTTVRVRLRSAIVDRWRPVSGWDMLLRRPKPVRRMVPAGSVYFFEVVDWGHHGWADLWGISVADDEQDARDGYGVAVCGVWDLV